MRNHDWLPANEITVIHLVRHMEMYGVTIPEFLDPVPLADRNRYTGRFCAVAVRVTDSLGDIIELPYLALVCLDMDAEGRVIAFDVDRTTWENSDFLLGDMKGTENLSYAPVTMDFVPVSWR